MATIIDTFIVKLGLDSSDLSKKGGDATKSLKSLESQGAKTEQGVSKIGKTSKEAASGVGELTKAFAGLLAVLGGAAALRAFIEDTIDSNAALSRLSKNLGVSVEDITAWGQAVEGLGGSAKGLQGTLSMLSQSQTELRLTGQSSLIPYFSSLGVAMAGVGGQARPVNDILLDLSDRFSKLDRPTANNLGKMMGIDQDTLNLLLLGRKEVELTIKRQKEHNAVTKAQAEESAKLQKSLIALRQGFTALGRDLLQQASPAIEKFLAILTSLSSWIQTNREFIKDLGIILGVVAAGLTAVSIAASPITLTVAAVVALAAAIALLWQDYQNWKRGGDTLLDWEKWKPGIDAAKDAIKGLASIVKDSFGAIFDEVSAVQKLINGDWRGAIAAGRKSDEKVRKGLSTALHTGVIGGVAGVALKAAPGTVRAFRTANGQTGTKEYMKQYFMDRGWTAEQASGIAANLWAESSGNTQATGDSGHAFGVAQWHEDRQAAFRRYKGKDIRQATLDEQLDFVNHELQRRGGADLHRAKTAAEAGAIVSREYEGPKDKDGEARKRAILAQQINGISGASTNVARAGSTPAALASAGGGGVSIDISTLNINTPTADPAAHARDFTNSLRYQFTAQANSGLN